MRPPGIARSSPLRLALLAAAWPGAGALAQSEPAPAPPPPPASTEQITVVGSSPLLGSGIDRNLVPTTTQSLGAADIARQGAPDLLQALGTLASGVNLDNAAGNPYQPSLFYNGYEVSPLQGTPQGIAVYVNGIRFNTAFGDTVNWDMIPSVAINRLNIEGANPLFGLNALGGSVNLALKDGFSFHGAEADLSGGSFGQIQTDAQYGKQWGDQSLYVAGSVIHQDGWRDLQSTDIENFYGDWGIRHQGAELHIDLSLGNSVINGPATAPVQLLAADSRAQFTAPNEIDNRLVQPSIRLNLPLSDTLSLQTQAYYNYFSQHVLNGNAPNDTPCNNGSLLLCQAPGVPSTTLGGRTIPAYIPSGQYSQLDVQSTNSNGYGTALQLTDTGSLLGLRNHFVTGASFDGAQTSFGATPFIGGLTPLTRVVTGPLVLIDEPGNTIPASVAVTDAYAGWFASDTINLTRALAFTLSGRYNFAEIDLHDNHGGDLTGNHAFGHFNPGIGATYRFGPLATLYTSYAVSNRAPTPAELSCAGPKNSCSLANFFVGDPNLNQVIAHTVQIGVRGRADLPADIGLAYDFNLFRSENQNDITFINSPILNYAYFANVGQTRRQGFSARLDAHGDWFSAYLDYTYLDATFQSGYVESAGNNPAASPNGTITVRPGDTLPGLPRNVLKLGLDIDFTSRFHAGLDGLLQSGQFLIGDEANLTPRLPGFFTLNAHASYDITPHLQLFASAENLLDRRYYTFGTFGSTSAVFLAQAPNATNPRSYSLAAPLGFFGGVKVKF